MSYAIKCGFETRHAVTDSAKVDSIAESLAAKGWVGAPVVIYSNGVDVAVSGVHRLEACERIGFTPETITLAEVFSEAGLDLAEIEQEQDYDLSRIVEWLPGEIAEKYGIER